MSSPPEAEVAFVDGYAKVPRFSSMLQACRDAADGVVGAARHARAEQAFVTNQPEPSLLQPPPWLVTRAWIDNKPNKTKNPPDAGG